MTTTLPLWQLEKKLDELRREHKLIESRGAQIKRLIETAEYEITLRREKENQNG